MLLLSHAQCLMGIRKNLGASGCFPLYSSSVSHTFSSVTSLYLGKGRLVLLKELRGTGQLMVAVSGVFLYVAYKLKLSWELEI